MVHKMRLLLDTANLEDIKYFTSYYPIEGVTTNPTILSKEGGGCAQIASRYQKYYWRRQGASRSGR